MRVVIHMLSSANQLIVVGVKVDVELIDVGSKGGHVGVKGLEVLAEHFGHGFGVNGG